MSCKYSNSMYTLIEPTIEVSTLFEDIADEELIFDHIMEQKAISEEFQRDVDAFEHDEKIEAEKTSALIKSIDNHVVIPKTWEESPEPLARDLHRLNAKGMLNLIRFISYLSKYDELPKHEIERLVHGYLNHVESIEVIETIEDEFHRSMGVL